MKKILTSYIISFPLIVLGLVLLVQAANPYFLISADEAAIREIAVAPFQFVSGIILVILGLSSIIARYLIRER
ncbi:MAG: hypothetical protein OEV37_03105 [Candidatus Berkelbacteria bacterium]|nr:hypothetical protein [Candidatus Berkelbacteria bacterium]